MSETAVKLLRLYLLTTYLFGILFIVRLHNLLSNASTSVLFSQFYSHCDKLVVRNGFTIKQGFELLTSDCLDSHE